MLENDAKFVTRNLIEVVQNLHAKGIVVRDIKPENWVLDDRGFLKLIDFNHVAFLDDYPDGVLTEVVGTMGYMSPDVLKGNKNGYGKEADVWCLGCLIYEILSGKLPFKGTDKISINSATLLSPIEYYKYWSKDLKDLLSKIFINSPKHRITLDEIMSHPWMEGYTGDWVELLEKAHLKSTLPNDIKLKFTSEELLNMNLKDKSNANMNVPYGAAVGKPIPIPDKDSENKLYEKVYKRELSFG